MEVVSRYVAIRHHVEGSPSEADFEVKAAALRWSPESGEVLVRNLYLPLDPYQLHRMKRRSPSNLTIPAIVPGERIASSAVGEVVASGSAAYEEGDVVAGLLAWEEYSLFDPSSALGAFVHKVEASDLPLSYYASVLGSSGTTAYGGLYEVCKPKEGEKVFVSAASGSIGNLVGQFAKIAGCYVVGSAGTKAKVDLLKDKLGFDEAFNYREEPDLKSALKRYFPGGIDIYFDNVGGEMLDAAVGTMNAHGRVAACGAITEYTDAGGGRTAIAMADVVFRRIKVQGFLVSDFQDKRGEFRAVIADWVRQGKVQVVEDVSDGLESLPSAFAALFRGGNIGKKMVKLQ